MKSTKTLLIAAIAASALIVGSSSLRAQDSTNMPPVGVHGKGRPDIAKALDLTDDQKPKVKEIMKDAADKRKAVREDDSLSADDKKTKMKAIQDETTAKMKAVLTPDQFTKYQAMTKKMLHRNSLATPPATNTPPQS